MNRFLFALGIRFVGEHVAKVLINQFQDLDALRNATYDNLIEIPIYQTEDKSNNDGSDIGVPIQIPEGIELNLYWASSSER